ncbi:MAG: M48 family metallopeptidase [Kiritimatiellia bacterium]|nr:M48 family metallopeptidase [Kiritimatiellia bacterium]
MSRTRPYLFLVLGVGAAVLLAAAGCGTLAKVSGGLAEAAGQVGVIPQDQADSIKRGADSLEKTFEDITPEQEYYIGRAVIATVLKSYKAWDNPAANRYVNLLGQTLARASDQPETFGGYRFLILDSDDINAFAAPGGLIVITRGMLRLCRTEDALAAVLAHEIGHVQHRHGLRAISRGRLTSSLTILALEAGKHLGGQNLADVTKAFEGSIGDITQTLMNSGYSRKLETEADEAAVQILQRVGYDPFALIAMLEEMKKGLKPGGLDFAKTHPDPNDRIRLIRKALGTAESPAQPEARQRRFERALRGV